VAILRDARKSALLRMRSAEWHQYVRTSETIV
jgi:hypothetical protein